MGLRTKTIEPFRLPADEAKFQKMRRGATADARSALVRRTAVNITKHIRPDDWIGQVRAIHRWVRDAIRYVHDANREEDLASSAEVLRTGADDCDGKARLAVALAKSLGIDADLHPVWRGPVLGHVQWKARFPGSVRFTKDPDGWVISDVTIKGAEVGQNPREIPVNPETGKLPLS